MVYFRLLLLFELKVTGGFACGIEFLQETLPECFIHGLALHFVMNMNIWLVISFLLQTKHKATDKTLEQHFLKEFKALETS